MNSAGHVQSRVVYFLMNIHLLPRSIYLTRHGESEYNKMSRIGGDSPLTSAGRSVSWLIDWLIDWLITQLIDCVTVRSQTARVLRIGEEGRLARVVQSEGARRTDCQHVASIGVVLGVLETTRWDWCRSLLIDLIDWLTQGICEGLTYEEIAERYPQQFENRDQDKYHYRYPSGEVCQWRSTQ